MEMPVNAKKLGAEDFDDIDEFNKYRLSSLRARLDLNRPENINDIIIPKLNLEIMISNIKLNDYMNNRDISSDVTYTKDDYYIHPSKIQESPPVDILDEFSVIVPPSAMHIPIVFSEPDKPANANIAVNKDHLAFISDKTHSESKKILQGLQELYANVKELRNDPHQMMTVPEVTDVSLDLFTYYNLVGSKKPVECSTMGKVLRSSLKSKKKSFKVDMRYYDPYGKIPMFDFNTPCPY